MKVSVNEYKQSLLYPNIVKAVSECLMESNAVEPIQVFVKLGYLKNEDLQHWKNGQIQVLENVISCNLNKAGIILRILRYHAHDLNLSPSVVIYKKKGEMLRFSKSGEKNIEKAYSTNLLRLKKVKSKITNQQPKK